ncbi:hypothetical protein SAMN05216324_11122 [Chryseobacterium limigenitum]|uniref:Uncharacterized protein n=1 Tax=Chryseobacterium limigenitum TaxID=1612149 RepID=A0A1K2IT77_9FLAO|nr:hypothetical protein SAMN05216324_11122 [Chryseobacterium limigenitum]
MIWKVVALKKRILATASSLELFEKGEVDFV